MEKFHNIPLSSFFKKNFSDIVRWNMKQDKIPYTENRKSENYSIVAKIVEVKKYSLFFWHFKINEIHSLPDFLGQY